MRARLLLCAALGAAACDNAGDSLGFPDLVEGQIGVAFYLDRDGSGTFTDGDTVYAGARVALLLAEGTDTVRSATSGADGVARFDDVPIGSYRVRVDRAALPDSIASAAGDTGTIRILARTDSIAGSRLVRLAFREATLADVRTLPTGTRVFVRGRVLAGLQMFSDSTAHLSGGGSFLRVTGAVHRPGRNGNNPGDSVSVLGTVGTRAGQPVLQDGLVASLAEGPAPIAAAVTLAEARTARGGELDAALVQLPAAAIADTTTDGQDFVVRLALDPDTVTVRVDPKLNPNRASFAPARTVVMRGVLVPVGDGTWYLRPRPVAGEVVFQ